MSRVRAHRGVTVRRVWILIAVALVAAGCAEDRDESAPAPEPVCDWPMAGHGPDRLGRQPCPSRLDAETVPQLEEKWFVAATDVVTATPAVADGVAYVGDWAGQAMAIELDTAEVLWRADLSDPTPVVYAGQITSSPALADVEGRELVIFASGPWVIALDRTDGSEEWRRAVGSHDPDEATDPTEIQGSPVVVPGDPPRVVVGFDVHNVPGHDAGVTALDAATGEILWSWVPEEGRRGCADVWGAPSVDLEAGLVFAGTGNCPGSPRDWGPTTEAIVALELETGKLRWSYQPHQPNNDDLDFAGAPNLFRIGRRDVVGLGNKDGKYYVVDRRTGQLLWEAAPSGPTITRPGSNFSTGGIIGAAALAADSTIVVASAGDERPFLHGLDAETGEIRWQQDDPDATYAGVTTVNDIAFTGGNDFTLRAVRTRDGAIRWSAELRGAIAAAPAIVGDRVVAVAGLREPGKGTTSVSSGVSLFGLPDDDVAVSTTAATTTTAPARPVRLAPTQQRCVGEPCTIGFQFKDPPEGLTPTITAEVTTDPFRIRIQAEGLGEPIRWLDPRGPNVRVGATVYGAVLSASDDNPLAAGLLCVLDASGVCEVTDVPVRSPSYNRLTILALADANTPPTLADGYDRLVVTHSFDPPLQEVP